MPEVCGNIKTELEANHNGLTALAQLIAIYTSAGIVNVSDIAKRTGYSDRAVRKAKAELGCRNPGADGGTPVPEPGCHTGTPVPKRNPGAGTPVPEPSRAHATNELPTEVLSSSKLVPPLAPQGGRQRGSRLETDWQLPDDWRMWARTNYPASTDEQVADQAERFRDYWIAKPGAQACKLDWQATWRNWCRQGLSAIGSVRKPQSTGSFKPTSFTPYVVPYVAPKQSKGISQAELEAMVLADEASYAG